MTDIAIPTPAPVDLSHRDTMKAVRRGLMCRCPSCGEGKLFVRFLKPTPACTHCAADMTPQRADDAPPYVVAFIVGHIVVGLNLYFDSAADWPLWLHFCVWPALALALCLAMLQPVKGALIGYQWAMRMHGFDPHGDVHEVPATPSTPTRNGVSR
jgi:uncharacterized protein (DUF983 family)